MKGNIYNRVMEINQKINSKGNLKIPQEFV